MSVAMSDKKPEPWYKQGWPWFLIFFPATAVVAGFITLAIAINTWDGLVVDDYYKEGRAIVQTLGRAERARELGLTAQFKVTAESIRIDLSALDPANVPRMIHLTIAHPTRGGSDQLLDLTGEGGVFEAKIESLSTGRWLFQIEDESRSWRMNGATYLPTETEFRIDSSGS
ncbi:nitrogen fixation protein FixH [Azoarcus communis]|uniref:Nitrogen fixation protein FixH n=2 Tax=Parazoarcus communis TaxID=41977 RepID=A0A323UXF6_9RHOO|nr:nitrogen fixation protein FixH [Parazoarcus communis]NMG71795.1 nitrogen fixation protein FixH [Parazoarcus communis SWub3 = DSM 12120]PZA17239.1 nitrogen fixation protein FixH [Azoarcus communis] [Parazoarcus communis SWub3 = DSM 12120]